MLAGERAQSRLYPVTAMAAVIGTIAPRSRELQRGQVLRRR